MTNGDNFNHFKTLSNDIKFRNSIKQEQEKTGSISKKLNLNFEKIVENIKGEESHSNVNNMNMNQAFDMADGFFSE